MFSNKILRIKYKNHRDLCDYIRLYNYITILDIHNKNINKYTSKK